MSREASSGYGFEVAKIVDAPRSLVFELWTKPAYVSLWWGIKGSKVIRCEMDVRPGGSWRIDMQTRSGAVYPNSGTYLIVRAPELIIYDDVPRDDSPAWGGAAVAPYVHTVRFADAGAERTAVTHEVNFASRSDCEKLLAQGMQRGLSEELDRLEMALASSRKAS